MLSLTSSTPFSSLIHFSKTSNLTPPLPNSPMGNFSSSLTPSPSILTSFLTSPSTSFSDHMILTFPDARPFTMLRQSLRPARDQWDMWEGEWKMISLMYDFLSEGFISLTRSFSSSVRTPCTARSSFCTDPKKKLTTSASLTLPATISLTPPFSLLIPFALPASTTPLITTQPGTYPFAGLYRRVRRTYCPDMHIPAFRIG